MDDVDRDFLAAAKKQSLLTGVHATVVNRRDLADLIRACPNIYLEWAETSRGIIVWPIFYTDEGQKKKLVQLREP